MARVWLQGAVSATRSYYRTTRVDDLPAGFFWIVIQVDCNSYFIVSTWSRTSRTAGTTAVNTSFVAILDAIETSRPAAATVSLQARSIGYSVADYVTWLWAKTL